VQKKLKEKGLDLAQVIVIFVLLILPQIFGQFVITLFGVTEVKHYLNIFIPLTGIMITYFLFIMYFHQLLINRIYDLVYLKYLVVILILFWIMYDGVTAYYMQSNFTILQNKIGPRDIVWRDVPFEQLPEYVIYPNFKYAFMFCLSVSRFIILTILAISLMSEKEEKIINKNKHRQKFKKKSIEELKANLHPSILKKYQDENK